MNINILGETVEVKNIKLFDLLAIKPTFEVKVTASYSKHWAEDDQFHGLYVMVGGDGTPTLVVAFPDGIGMVEQGQISAIQRI